MRAAHARMFQGPPAPRGSPQQLQRLRAARARATAQGHAPAAALGLTCHCARPNMATALGLTFSPPSSRPGGEGRRSGGVRVVCSFCFSFLLRTASKARKDTGEVCCSVFDGGKTETCSRQTMSLFCTTTTTTTRKQRRNWKGAQLESQIGL